MDESVVNGLFKAVQGFIQATRTEHVNDELINAMVTMACTMILAKLTDSLFL